MKRVKEIFGEALQHSGAARDAFLMRACGEDQALRTEVEELLAALARAGESLGTTTVTQEGQSTERPKTTIGPYTLLEQIGEGGFGVVHMAQQERPFRRKVALKIIKPG